MTNDLKTQYRELIALAQLYLLENHALKERILVDSQTFNFFKAEANLRKTKASQAPRLSSEPPSEKINRAALPAHPNGPPPETLPVQPSKPPQTLPLDLPSFPVAPPKKINEIPKKPAPSAAITEKQPIKTSKKKSELFTLEPMLESASSDFSEIRKIVTERFSTLTLLDDIPSDAGARKINNAWQAEIVISEVVILSFNEAFKQKAFLNNMAWAICQHLAPASVLSAQKFELDGWNALLQAKELRLIIASDYAIHAMPGLMKHYREAQKQGKFYLDKVPLCLLSDLSLYLKEPHLKLPLWKAICDMLLVKNQVTEQ